MYFVANNGSGVAEGADTVSIIRMNVRLWKLREDSTRSCRLSALDRGTTRLQRVIFSRDWLESSITHTHTSRDVLSTSTSAFEC